MKFSKIFLLPLLAVTLQSCLRDNDDPVAIPPLEGAVVKPNVGGATEPNQVWVDLSDKGASVTNKRTDWDLAFYSGDQFRVILNASIGMAAGVIPNVTDIDKVTSADVAALKAQVAVGTFTGTNMQYVDNPNGNFLTQTTGIKEISANDSDNGVYLINMGKAIATTTVAPGSVATGGDARGFMKVQILRSAGGYKIKFANLDDKTHKEVLIAKDNAYNFNFFSLISGSEVKIQPTKKNWDLAFTVFTNEVFTGPTSAGSYIYADFVITNTLANVGVYEVKLNAGDNLDTVYNNFKKENIDATKFSSNDQRVIGDTWRTTTGANGAQTYGDRFYIIRDADGFFFKLRFNKLASSEGVRGNPEFEFQPL